MKIQFSKMHGLGNDFIVVNAMTCKINTQQLPIPLLADRHRGIGFDQLLLIETAQSHDTDFYYRIFNADGSEAAHCGNGARCVAKFLCDNNMVSRKTITLGTCSGKLELEYINDEFITVNMGIPNFIPDKIPVLMQQQSQYQLLIDNQYITASILSLGNPHCVIMVENVDTAPVQHIGSRLQTHPLFPEQVNVGFMQIINKNTIKLRVFERGAGETLACGSGACAAMVAGYQLKVLASDVHVQLPGGDLNICWQGLSHAVMMSGPAAFVYHGEIIV